MSRCLALSLLALPLVLDAQEPPDTTRTRLREIRVSAPRTSTTVGGSSAVVLAIDSLRLTPAASLEDGLREMPFVLVRQNSRGEVELSVRGSDSRQAAVLFDGLPLSTGWDHRADPSVFPLSGVGTIVLVRGLSTLLQGPNTLGGIVDLGVVSDRAGRVSERVLRLQSAVDQLGTRLWQADWANAHAMRTGELTVRAGGGYRDRPAVRLSHRIADEYSTESGRRANSDVQQRDGYGALRYQTNGGAWLGASLSAYEVERGVMPELHLSTPRFWRYPEQSRQLAVFSAGSGRRKTPLGSGDVELVVGRNGSRMLAQSFLNARYDSIVNTERGHERTTTARVLADHSLGRGELRTAFTLSNIRHTETLNRAAPSEYQQRLWSSGAEVDFPIAGGFRFTGGLVAAASTTPLTGGKPSLGRVGEWGGRLGISGLALGNRARVHVSMSRRARFAALRELYSGALNQFEPNPELRPERLVGAEVGATLLSADRQFQAVLFTHHLSDAIVRIALPNRSFKRINRDVLRSSGLELLGGTRLGRVSLTADALLQRVRLADPAVSGTNRQPEHQPALRIGTDAAIPLGTVRARLGVNYSGKQYCVNPDRGGNQALGAQVVANTGAERSFRLRSGGLLSKLLVSLGIDNVLDHAVYDQCGLPTPGRTIRMGVSLS